MIIKSANMEETKSTEVETTKEVAGKVVYGGKAINLPAPATLARWMNAVKYFCATSILMVSGSTIFDGNTSKVITFILSAVIIGAGAVKLSVGVEPEDDNKVK